MKLDHIGRCHVVVTRGVVAPEVHLLPGEPVAKVHVVGLLAVQVRPRPLQVDAGVLGDDAEDAVAGPVVSRELVVVLPLELVLLDDHSQGRVGQHEAGAAVGKHVVANLHLYSEVVRVALPEVGEPQEHLRPHNVRVRLHEDEPLGVGHLLERLLGDLQELPLVQPPAGAVAPKLAVLRMLPLLDLLGREGAGAALLQVLVV